MVPEGLEVFARTEVFVELSGERQPGAPDQSLVVTDVRSRSVERLTELFLTQTAFLAVSPQLIGKIGLQARQRIRVRGGRRHRLSVRYMADVAAIRWLSVVAPVQAGRKSTSEPPAKDERQ